MAYFLNPHDCLLVSDVACKSNNKLEVNLIWEMELKFSKNVLKQKVGCCRKIETMAAFNTSEVTVHEQK